MNNIRKHRKWWIMAIFAIIFLSYGLTTKMYFWQDDSALIFRLQHPVGPMGSFGPSIWADRGAYRYMVIPFVPFYPLFGLNPTGYFTIGVFTYVIAAFAFWSFARALTKSDLYATLGAFVFSAGYIGSDMLFRIINSWQSNTGLILSLLSLTMYAKYINKTKLRFYLLALLFYFLSIELVYIRSHSLVASIVILELAFANLHSLKRSLIRLVPFVLLFYFWYFRDPNFGSPDLPSVAMLSSFFATLGNAFVPNAVQNAIAKLAGDGSIIVIVLASVIVFGSMIRTITARKILPVIVAVGSLGVVIANYILFIQGYYWYKNADTYISATIGALVAYNLSIISILAWKKREGKILLVSLVFLASQIFGYFMQYPTAVFATTHRYLYFAIIGYSMIFVILPSFYGKKASVVFVGMLVIVNLALSQQYQQSLLKDRSVPSWNFYSELLSEVPQIEPNALFFFDVEADPYYQHQFSDFFSVGSMPESTALAIYYGLDRDEIVFLTDYDELISLVSQNPERLKNTYTFFYGRNGLVNTTEVTRTTLDADVQAKHTLVPGYLEIEFDADVHVNHDELSSTPLNDSLHTQQLLSYFAARNRYYRDSRIDVLSEWKFQEKEYAIDNDSSTSWRGHRIYWDDNEHDVITIDLASERSISRVVWENWIPSLTPTDYTIETSRDGVTWSSAKEVHNGEKSSGDKIEVRFEPRDARYVRIHINETVTNDSPAISEIEVIESSFDELSLSTINSFIADPFSYTSVPPLELLHISVEVLTDRGLSLQAIPVSKYGLARYKTTLFVGGTQILDIKITTYDPLDIITKNIMAKNLTLDMIREQNLVKRFSVN